MKYSTFIFIFLLFLVFTSSLSAQKINDWEPITEDLLTSINDTSFAKDPLNRKVGTLAVVPGSGDLFLVLNGEHAVYKSKNQGKSWRKINDASTKGRAYGSFSTNIDVANSRLAIFMIVQKKNRPARGLILERNGKVLTEIGKPDTSHDGWTWGMPAWDNPDVILGKEHHAWVVLWLSEDGGESWEKLDFESRNPGVIDSQTFVAGNDDGIYRSADQGKTWNKVSDFVVTGKNPVKYGDNFYWTTNEGVIVTKDGGKSWNVLGEPINGALWGPYFGSSEASMMIVNEEGFFITKNGGETWNKAADFFTIPDAANDGKYNVMHPTNSYGWDEKRNIIYAAGLGSNAYRLILNKETE